MTEPSDKEESTDLNTMIGNREKPFWEPIGKFIFRFGSLEAWVDKCLALLIEVEYYDVGTYVLRDIDFLARAKLLQVFARGTDDALKSEMKGLIQEVEDLNTFRNNLVHGEWTAHFSDIDERGPAWQKATLSRRYNFSGFTVTRDEILMQADAVENVRIRLNKLSQKVREKRAELFAKREAKSAAARGEPPPSPDMPPPQSPEK